MLVLFQKCGHELLQAHHLFQRTKGSVEKSNGERKKQDCRGPIAGNGGVEHDKEEEEAEDEFEDRSEALNGLVAALATQSLYGPLRSHLIPYGYL